MTKFR